EHRSKPVGRAGSGLAQRPEGIVDRADEPVESRPTQMVMPVQDQAGKKSHKTHHENVMPREVHDVEYDLLASPLEPLCNIAAWPLTEYTAISGWNLCRTPS